MPAFLQVKKDFSVNKIEADNTVNVTPTKTKFSADYELAIIDGPPMYTVTINPGIIIYNLYVYYFYSQFRMRSR